MWYHKHSNTHRKKDMSHKLPKKISAKLETLIREGVKMSGSYKPEEAMLYIEESLTLAEFIQVEAFLQWTTDNSRTFGWDLPEVYADFVAHNGQAFFDANIERHGYSQEEPLEFNFNNINVASIQVVEHPASRK